MGRLAELFAIAAARAKEANLPYAGALTPKEAHEVMQLAPGAKLVDVRTNAEWEWVGRVPNAVEIEWLKHPGRVQNDQFVEQLKQSVTPESTVLFLCRGGVRSSSAAKAATEAGYSACYNVLEGFEGDKDAEGHRKTVNGWCAAGLPWTQG